MADGALLALGGIGDSECLSDAFAALGTKDGIGASVGVFFHPDPRLIVAFPPSVTAR